jgi:hypothetical protein
MQLITQMRNRVKETLSFSGSILSAQQTLLGAATTYASFSTQYGANTSNIPFTVVDNSSGQWVTGYGVYTHSGTKFQATAITDSSAGANTDVSFSAGTKDIIVGLNKYTVAHSIPLKNYIDNPSCQIAQRVSVGSLTVNSPVLGGVDRWFIGTASASTLSAGTLDQNTGVAGCSTGCTARANGFTTTGASTQVIHRQVILAPDAIELNSKTIIVQALVQHNVGSNVNYTIQIEKPTASDNYASTTSLGTSSAVAVATGTLTQISYSITLASTDASNGLRVTIAAACGAVTTKNFEVTDIGLYQSDTVQHFVANTKADDILACELHYEKSYDLTVAPGTSTGFGAFGVTGVTTTTFSVRLRTRKYINSIVTYPTVTCYSTTGASGYIRNNNTAADVAVTLATVGATGAVYTCSTTTGHSLYGHYTAYSGY